MTPIESVISTDDGLATLVNVFEVDAARQQELVDVLTEGAEAVIRHRPGFVSVNILASLDGGKVVNYAQWRSADDIAATLADPDARSWAGKAAAIATPAAGVYSVAAIRHA